MGYCLIDIGELGWSLYMVAHARWLKKNGHRIHVITYPDRVPLYEGIYDSFSHAPDRFYTDFPVEKQDCFGIHGIARDRLESFFKNFMPVNHRLPEKFYFSCDWEMFRDKAIYKPFKSGVKERVRDSIIIFPRCRQSKHHAYRNVPSDFYENLIDALVDAGYNKIVLVGSENGAYNIQHRKVTNLIGKTDLQGLIDLCESAFGAIGGTSAPPKISLLQGVPTFVIGHEKERFTKTENWMNTKVGFYELNDYNDFDHIDCIREILEFL